MAAVNTARIKSVHTMHDGRKYVTEEIVDTQGGFHPHLYLAAAGEDLQGHLEMTQAQYETDLKAAEFEQVYQEVLTEGPPPDPSLKFSTRSELVHYMRERYPEMRGLPAVHMSQFLLAQSDTDLRSVFSLSTGQLASLKVRLHNRMTVAIGNLHTVEGE